jgi:hypothetical protein
MSLDTYMGIRDAVITEVLAAENRVVHSECTEAGEEDCAD